MKPFSPAALWLLATSTIAATIEWKSCPELAANTSNATNATLTYQCANLTVPLDYQDNSSKPLMLNLLKLNAPTQPSRGSILMNPGGPGTAGRNALYEFGQLFVAATGYEHDIVTWDPRGTGNTLPVSCYANDSDRVDLDALPLNTSDESISASLKHAQSLATACQTALAGTGQLLGSAYVARDMERIIDALGEDRLLRYYGLSYGSALGQIFAAMFPDKVDKMVIDGVVNIRQYMAGTIIEDVASTEAVWTGFLGTCLSRPSLCPLTDQLSPTRNLHQQMDELFAQLEAQPIALGPRPSDQYTVGMLKSAILIELYNATLWPGASSELNAVLNNDTASLLQQLNSAAAASAGPFPEYSEPENAEAIRCSDTAWRTSNVAELAPVVKAQFAQTPHFGGASANALTIACAQWPFVAKERAVSNFGVQLKNPMLVISNMFDPVTSLYSARNATYLWKNSVLLVQEGYGHTSLRLASKCRDNAVAAFFNQGLLPDAETVCRQDLTIFGTQE